MVYVTHDQVEAMTMGHRIAVLSGGVLQQCDTPRTVYERPRNTFVATFLGSPAMNLSTVPLAGEYALLGQIRVRLTSTVLNAAHRARLDSIILGLRPEALERVPHGEGLPLDVQVVEALGADAFVHGEIESSAGVVSMIVRVDGRAAPRVGEVLRLRVHEAEAHAFDPDTGRRLD
jgi:multiple sugar transport system ATP-binding protein